MNLQNRVNESKKLLEEIETHGLKEDEFLELTGIKPIYKLIQVGKFLNLQSHILNGKMFAAMITELMKVEKKAKNMKLLKRINKDELEKGNRLDK